MNREAIKQNRAFSGLGSGENIFDKTLIQIFSRVLLSSIVSNKVHPIDLGLEF